MIAYFIRKFPQLSETFIANEIVELGRQGIEPRIYSYKHPTEDVRHECVRLIRSPITYLPEPLWRSSAEIIGAHRALRRADPERYRATLRFALEIWRWKGQFRAYREFARAGWLAKRIQEDGITHIHAHMAHTCTQVAMLVSMMTGIPYSFTAHAYDIYTANQADLKKRIDGAQFIATCTGANVEHLKKLAGPEQADKVRLQYHGVDLDRFSLDPIRETDGAPLILAVGRLVEKKGFPDLLQACAMLKARGKEFRCRIIGEGPDRKSLLDQIKALDVKDVVELPGAMSQEELIEIYRRAADSQCPHGSDGDRHAGGFVLGLGHSGTGDGRRKRSSRFPA
jgi:glycosyltransferase involved in cell wall biosynthesis